MSIVNCKVFLVNNIIGGCGRIGGCESYSFNGQVWEYYLLSDGEWI